MLDAAEFHIAESTAGRTGSALHLSGHLLKLAELLRSHRLFVHACCPVDVKNGVCNHLHRTANKHLSCTRVHVFFKPNLLRERVCHRERHRYDMKT